MHDLYARRPHYLEMIRELTIFFLKWERASNQDKDATRINQGAQAKATSGTESKSAPKPVFQQMAFLLFGDQDDDDMKMTSDVFTYFGKNSKTMLNVAWSHAV